MSLDEQFQDALEQVKAVASPTPQVLLNLYGLFKQATTGDVTGDRPGMLDMRGRAKYDAWASRKGLSRMRRRKSTSSTFRSFWDNLPAGIPTPR